MFVECFIDGACRGAGLPGRQRAACAVVMYNKRKEISRCARLLGDRSNNEAEYEALTLALIMLSMSGAINPVIYSDSAVVVNQVNGKWKVRSNNLVPYWITIAEIKKDYNFKLIQVPRTKVYVPDSLCNQILDEEEEYYVRQQ